ncbi:hypothetical protein P167DRAFT_547684 [Morchella conica CCBAS932]|uniref:Uncharacterized protein n=1 Tax=Morchella conica CCBAS932 TaxID=1392247 RepID=A0A3N4KKH9_9PEZI|nr:hypothetical protein P167DRAFT_547684 [Morchella conica CCBAS932]
MADQTPNSAPQRPRTGFVMNSMVVMTVTSVSSAVLSSLLGIDSPNARTFVSVQTDGNIAFETNLRHQPLPAGVPTPSTVFDFNTVLVSDLQASSDARRAAALAREQRRAAAAARAETPATEQNPGPAPQAEPEVDQTDASGV